ncbi:MAG TPA: asparagine synthase (glutamine-hydrolyzing) [Vicinamibacterales bacterium]|nr:asparagine synthase (glutamine-hydrolyzing) [Vicinamibacterales bacterium]
MCGIAGWLSSAHDVDAGVLDRMRDALAHRGPDDAASWVSPDRHAGLGFRRLAIIDLAPAASQPMTNEDGRLQLVFNGEIYNHAALRVELEQRGHRFRTDHSDTETIVHGFEEWGPDVVHHLDGMFAFAVYDRRDRTLFFARDRVGIKPLYFTQAHGAFLFASEIKALLCHPAVSRDVDPWALYHYLSFLAAPAPLTMFKGIHKVPAGHRGTVSGPDVRLESYWDALPRTGDAAGPRVDVAAAAGDVSRLLQAAVSKRLMSDVPFGVLLSGGIDSSLITALMAREMSQPVRTFTVGFSDHRRLNEVDEARAVARRFATDHHEIMVAERDMAAYVPELVTTQDEPLADWVCVPLYFVSRLVRQSGTVVVQVGEGSDEQFCGYASYMGYLKLYEQYWEPWRRLPQSVRRAAASTAVAVGRMLDRGALYADIAARAARDREHFWGGAVCFWETDKTQLVNRTAFSGAPSAVAPGDFSTADTYEVVKHHLARLDAAWPEADVLARMTYLEFKQRLPELLLMRVDKITMSTSVEARVPFLDYRLVEYTMGLPMEVKLAGGVKGLLKKVARGVIPDEVIDRPKVGFGAPMAEWLRGDFGRDAEAAIMRSRLRERGFFDYDRIARLFASHRSGTDRSLPLWTIYNLTAWYDRWIP